MDKNLINKMNKKELKKLELKLTKHRKRIDFLVVVSLSLFSVVFAILGQLLVSLFMFILLMIRLFIMRKDD